MYNLHVSTALERIGEARWDLRRKEKKEIDGFTCDVNPSCEREKEEEREEGGRKR